MKPFTIRFAFAVSLILTFFITIPSPPSLAQEEVIYSQDFNEGPAGWTTFDFYTIGIMWHQTNYGDLGVAWCGTDDPSYVNPPGYGNNWVQALSKSFTLPAGEPSLSFSIQFDTESDFDFWYAEISNDGGATFEELHKADGISPGEGFYTYSSDLSYYAGLDVVIRFLFTSDASWSDEDGLRDSNGACRLDWVEVAGQYDNFDTSLDGWIPDSLEPGGGPYRLETDLGGNPTLAWAAYDLDGPHAGQFPWTPEEFRELNMWVHFGIESPTIAIPPDLDSYILEFDVYRHLPLCEWVFFEFEVATPAPEDGGVWRSDIYIYYATDDPPIWRPSRLDLMNVRVGTDEFGNDIFGSIIEPGATSMRIRLIGREYSLDYVPIPFCGQHPAGPLFDNVRLLRSFPGTLSGNVIADCPAVDTPLYGVTVVVYDGEAEAGSAVTDETGAFEMTLPSGFYTLSLVTPLGYGAIPGEYSVEVTPDGTTVQDFSLTCLDIAANPRSIGYWKHGVSQALGGPGKGSNNKIKVGKGGGGEEPADLDSPICDYLDLIQGHFNSNAINQVIVYEAPASDLCLDKLNIAADLLNLLGSQEMVDRAQQQLMALLLNAAAGNIHLTEVISEDGATVSQAITYCDHLIDNPIGDHEAAKTIADLVNNGIPVPAGMIPLDTDQIAYRQRVPSTTLLLGNHPNPFNPSTTIQFTLPEARDFQLSVYDGTGRLVRTFDGAGNRGMNEVIWDGSAASGRRVSSGVYFAILDADGLRETTKMTLLK